MKTLIALVVAFTFGGLFVSACTDAVDAAPPKKQLKFGGGLQQQQAQPVGIATPISISQTLTGYKGVPIGVNRIPGQGIQITVTISDAGGVQHGLAVYYISEDGSTITNKQGQVLPGISLVEISTAQAALDTATSDLLSALNASGNMGL